MIMRARHHVWGSGYVPHRISMTRRWGPVGLMRVGGMGLGQLTADWWSTGGGVSASTPWPSGSGSGVNTEAGFVPVSSIGPAARGARVGSVVHLPYAPPHPSVVNPSPVTQLTTTGSSATAPASVVSQANGAVALAGATASTVGGQVSTTGDVTGLSGCVFVAGLVAALVLLTRK